MAAAVLESDCEDIAARLATQGYALVGDWLDASAAAALRAEAARCAFGPSRVISGGKRVVDAERTDEVCWLRPGAGAGGPALERCAGRLRVLGARLGAALARSDAAARRFAPPGVRAAYARASQRAGVRRGEAAPASLLAGPGDGAAAEPPAMLARYARGARFTAHVDAAAPAELPFGTPPDPRVLTAVVYLSGGAWRPAHGGVLRLERPLHADRGAGLRALLDADPRTLAVPPKRGLLVLFWSTLVRHEVLPAAEERLALSMWFNEPPPRPSAAACCDKE